ncbi:Hypothetical protein FKW44_010578, partial [Caligus rogercresseyi]
DNVPSGSIALGASIGTSSSSPGFGLSQVSESGINIVAENLDSGRINKQRLDPQLIMEHRTRSQSSSKRDKPDSNNSPIRITLLN